VLRSWRASCRDTRAREMNVASSEEVLKIV
jgi:hypothetical protein